MHIRTALNRAWGRWLNWTAWGVGIALVVASRWWSPLLWPGIVLWVGAGLINIGYGVAILRMLWLKRAKRRAGAL